MIAKQFTSLVERLARRNHSPHKLAITFCLGIYIGLSPFIGFRTLITLVCGWLFALDVAALLAISLFIHNPWTIIPIYTFAHGIGQQLFTLFDINGVQLDPTWIESWSVVLQQHTGIGGVSLSAFLVGGNLLGISTSLLLYPFIKRMFTNYLAKKNNKIIS